MKTLQELEALFKLDYEANKKSLEQWQEASNYYHSYQLPEVVRSVVEERGQVPIFENLFRTIVNKILGYKTQSLTSVSVSGRQEEDKALAHLLNDLIKSFNESHTYDREILKRDLDLILGIGILELWVCGQEDKEISLRAIEPTSFIIDKYSTDKNALDSRRFHKVLNLSLEQAKEILGNKNFKTILDGQYETRVCLCESWIQEKGLWNRYVWYPNYAIYCFEKQPFKNNIHPFVVSKYNIDDKGLFYGIFRDIKPLQDYINFAENRMGNMLGSFKAFYEAGAVGDKEEFIASASLDNSFTEVQSGGIEKIKFIENRGDIAMISQKVQEKRALAKMISGVNDEVLGLGGTRQSGSAIAQRRDAGLMSLQDYIKTSDDMDKLLYSKVLDLMQHYYTKAQVFRIVDKKVGDRYFHINTNAQNTIKIGKFDLSYKTTLKMLGREERFTHWSEIFKTIASVSPELVAGLLPLMLKDTDSPIIADVEELMAQVKEAKAQEAQSQAAAQIQQIQIQKAQSEILESEAKARKYDAQGQLAAKLAREDTKKGVDLR